MRTKKLKNELVLACKILVNQHLDSGPFGNVSIKVPGKNQFLINPAGITFEQLKIDDILCVDFNGKVIEGKHKEAHPGEFIHREIYRLREDVSAIVHTHSENTVIMSLLGCLIEPFTQLGSSIYSDQGIYQGFNGPVRTSKEGLAIATALGNKSLVIAKNHGLFAVGSSLPAALWDMIVADKASKIHLAARRMGLLKANKLSNKLMKKSKIEVRDKQCELMWNALKVQSLHTTKISKKI